MNEMKLSDDLNDLIGRHVQAAVARLIGQLSRDIRDGDTLGMVLNRAAFPIRDEMERLVFHIVNHMELEEVAAARIIPG